MRFLLLVLLISGFSIGSLTGQDKFEREYRISEKLIPSPALVFVDSLNPEKCLKWYREEGLKSQTIEAKFKKGGSKHSVEFDTLGSIEDIEITISEVELPAAVLARINAHLAENHSRVRIKKIQRQFTGSEEALLSEFTSSGTPEPVTIRYELVVRGKTKRHTHLWEYLFSETGAFIKKFHIVQSNTDYLEY